MEDGEVEASSGDPKFPVSAPHVWIYSESESAFWSLLNHDRLSFSASLVVPSPASILAPEECRGRVDSGATTNEKN